MKLEDVGTHLDTTDTTDDRGDADSDGDALSTQVYGDGGGLLNNNNGQDNDAELSDDGTQVYSAGNQLSLSLPLSEPPQGFY